MGVIFMCPQLGGTGCSVAATQLQDPWFDPVWTFACFPGAGFFQVLQFSPVVQTMEVEVLATLNCS